MLKAARVRKANENTEEQDVDEDAAARRFCDVERRDVVLAESDGAAVEVENHGT